MTCKGTTYYVATFVRLSIQSSQLQSSNPVMVKILLNLINLNYETEINITDLGMQLKYVLFLVIFLENVTRM